MPNPLGAFSTTQPVIGQTNFAPADTTVAKAIVGAQSGPYSVIGIIICSTDTAARVVDIYLRTSASNFLLGSVSVPASTGLLGTPGVNALAAWSAPLADGFDLPAATTIQAAMETTITAALLVTITPLIALY